MPSEREKIQHELAEFCNTNNLNQPYGVIESKQMLNGKSVRTITFCIPLMLDATITIYGPKFILLEWSTTVRRMPNIGHEKFENIEQVKRFITNNFAI